MPSYPGRERSYDIELNGDGYIVSGGGRGNNALWMEEAISPVLGGPAPLGEQRETIDTLHYGYGYGRLWVPGCYDYALNMDCSLPGFITMGPQVVNLTIGGSANVSDFFEQNGQLYVLAGRYCKRINVADDTVQTPNNGSDGKDFGASTVATKAMPFKGNIYVGFSSDTAIQSFASNTWDNIDPDTPAVATTVRAKYWAKEWQDTFGYRLWRGYGTDSVNGCANNPLRATDWTPAAFEVGESTYAITGMVAQDRTVWVTKTDGLYALDWTTRAPNNLKALASFIDSDNGVNPIMDGPNVMLPHLMGLLQYDGRQVSSIHPGASTGNTSPVYGKVTAQKLVGEWHYVALYNGTDTYILKGRNPHGGEGLPQGFAGRKMWHPVAKIASARCDCMHVSNLTTPNRLWFGRGTDCSYIRISPTGNQLTESNMRWAASGSIYLSPLPWQVPNVYKEVLAHDMVNSGLSASTYVDIYLAFDGGSYAKWGTASTAGLSTVGLPNSGTWRGYLTSIRLDFVNADATTTPKVKSYVPRASLRPTMQDVITTQILCMDKLLLRDGVPERHRDGKTMLSNLKALRTGAPVSLIDYWTGSKRTQTVIVEKVTDKIIQQRGIDPAGYGAEITMRVLA